MSLDPCPRAVHVALGRPHRNPRHARDLRVGKAEGIAEHDDGTLLRGQARERLGDIAAQIGERGQARRVRVLVDSMVLEDKRLRAANSLEGSPVPARIDDQAMEPRRELGLAAKLPQACAELDQRLLSGVARLLEVAEQLRGEPVDLGSVPLDENVQGAPVAARCLAHELRVAQPLVSPPGMPIPLVQTGLSFDRLHGAVSVIK